MYAGRYATSTPDRPVCIMAGGGEAVTYREFDRRSNRIAHLLRAHGLNRLDHFAMLMENTPRFLEVCAAGERSGLYYTCINSYLTAGEVAYVADNCEARAFFTTREKLPIARQALAACPKVTLRIVVDAPSQDGFMNLDEAVAAYPDQPISDEALGTPMLYSSGTTGRPKGILRPLPEQPPARQLPVFEFLIKLWRYREGITYLSPTPLYHSAPLGAVALTVRVGGTAIVMERFDPEHYLQLVEKHRVTHTQLVPTMFSRLLKLPAAIRNRYDLSSLEVAIHAAAPCPVQVKEAMIDWWGPIIHEYYGATEGMGFTACDTAEWLAHRGTVGRVLMGDLHVLDEAMQPCPRGTPGTLWFKSGSPFVYFNDPERTAASRSQDGSMSTVGDVGYLDEDGFLHLTDRATFMIICGGMNIYPQECENLLITHPKVADAAVFGVPDDDLGEVVKAVVQAAPGTAADAALEAELITFCKLHLASIKCPRSIDFTNELPRLPTGKLYKRVLRDPYWAGHKSRIV
ncbi:MAG: AMP-binding protein [Burkholderiales bacterium]